MSLDEQSLVVGQNDGVVKIFDLSRGGLEETQAIGAFVNPGGRKGAVTRLKFHPKNGSLFASSSLGCIKLLRLSI